MLPVQTAPIFNLTIPSTGKVVKYRPFLVKEQKALLIASATEDIIVMVDTLKTLIKTCLIDDVDVDRLAMFDIEYVFSQIRAKSVGEEVTLKMICTHCDLPENSIDVTIDISKIEVNKDPRHTTNILLFDDVGITMKYPGLDIINRYKDSKEDVNTIFAIITECIDNIYNSTEIFPKKDQTKEELEQFLGNLNTQQFEKIKMFFETMPTIKKDVEYECPVCHAKNKVTLEGISSFF